MKKKSLVVIPARLASTRLPGKPLLKVTGKYMVQYVYEAVSSSKADKVVVATDHQSIIDAVNSFGGEAVLTKDTHFAGTDRVAEAATMFPEYDIIINMQGDEPEIQPSMLNDLIEIQAQTNAFISTICCPFSGDWYNNCALPSTTKVVLGKKIPSDTHDIRKAIYFSRALIPYYRGNNQDLSAGNNYFLHMGMYGFSQKSLAEYVKLAPSLLEKTESLEQLRAIENGYEIVCGIVESSAVGIDTPADYDAFVERMKKKPL
jgi:3-deoxy-manno-octulosonate cytidylyltransferase (CMP-KDO synthetase)